jgi:hypothetical protein
MCGALLRHFGDQVGSRLGYPKKRNLHMITIWCTPQLAKGLWATPPLPQGVKD